MSLTYKQILIRIRQPQHNTAKIAVNSCVAHFLGFSSVVHRCLQLFYLRAIVVYMHAFVCMYVRRQIYIELAWALTLNY